jgi:hypothetical protein
MTRATTAALGLTLAWALGATAAPAMAGEVKLESSATAGATVQPNGPRGGPTGQRYFNVEGKNNGEKSAYASFGVLDFHLLKPATPAAKVNKLTLTLTQSVARFSKDGPVKVFASADTDASLEPGKSPLKFDPAAPGGVGGQLKTLHPLGGATFKIGKSGQADALVLDLPAESEAYLRGQVNAGGPIRLVLVPADDDVAATYAGPGAQDEGQRPRLRVDVETAGGG